MICSRPEWYLKSTLSDADFHGVCERKEVEVDDPEARGDVKRLLEAGVDKIRKRYKDRLPDGWPPEHHLWDITSVASGHLGFISFILRFIEDEEYADPDGQLQVCVKFLNSGGKVGVINPLHALDLLYRQILSNVPRNRLPITMRILGLVASRPDNLHSSDNQARFLNLDRTIFYQSLQHLHSVVYVPPTEKSSTTELRIYHASFSDFLLDSNRSGEFYLDGAVVVRDLVFQSLDCMENDDGSPSNEAVIKFSAPTVWGLSRFLSNDFLPAFISRLERFNFSRLTCAHTMTGTHKFEELQFAKFIEWLYSLGNTGNKSVINIVRETSPEDVSNVVIVDHFSYSPQKYIASFIPGTADSTLPFLLHFRLGKIAQVHIALRVVKHPNDQFRYFREYLGEIRQKFSDRLPANWPPDSDLLEITAAAHGDPEALCFLSRFIGLTGDLGCGDPDGQLKLCAKFLNGANPGDTVNPNKLNIYDSFYFHILSSVPADLLPTTMRVLGLLIISYHEHICSDDQAHFLDLDRKIFHQSIQHLHSVVCIPSMDNCSIVPLGFFTRSFHDFLTDPNRSGKYWLCKEALEYDFVLQCLHWLENDDGSPSNKAVIEFSALFVWISCYELSDGFIAALISRLEGFDFGRLKQAHIIRTQRALSIGGFGEFLRWLYSLGSIRNKSLISVVQEVSQEEASRPVHNELQAWHWIESPHDYIASFNLNPETPKFPLTLKLRLGKLSHVYILVEVDDSWNFPDLWSADTDADVVDLRRGGAVV
ncbi:hypothetical protein P691DRAFT_765029 [Macrolepiota fuliginosa MF-IS2]|uniref:Uncharacterized protein n=1 Tax=Macrolepiota fuliginosa MF-IS2 TaxID=1400762 RepID=A0A9P6BYF9_9AGAR|nr:hypothetical protein P691DRAFT_765029 [Macrolepiota fuliginosa MF-IS2]